MPTEKKNRSLPLSILYEWLVILIYLFFLRFFFQRSLLFFFFLLSYAVIYITEFCYRHIFPFYVFFLYYFIGKGKHIYIYLF